MTHLPFGTPARVTSAVEPRYLHWITSRTVYDPPTPSGGFRLGREVPVDPPVLEVESSKHAPDDLGDPLPDTDEVPLDGIHRRLRRFPLDDARGIIVGWVYRAEGRYSPGYVSGWDEPEEQPPYLSETGRHRLYQIAIDPGEVGNQFHPARIILAHPDDVKADR